MNHLLDHAAHAVLRGAIYRMLWHMPPVLLGILVMAAILALYRPRL